LGINKVEMMLEKQKSNTRTAVLSLLLEFQLL